MAEDIRIVKTKSAIENAFISLVESKGYKNVKMVDIAKKARVNRNTIYLRYGTKEDIIKSIISTSFQSETKDFGLESLIKIRFNRHRVELLYKALFSIIAKNIELFRILLLEDELVGFYLIELKNIKKTILSNLKNVPRNESLVNYLVYGVFGVIIDYTVYAKGTSDDNVKLLTDLTMATLRRIQL